MVVVTIAFGSGCGSSPCASGDVAELTVLRRAAMLRSLCILSLVFLRARTFVHKLRRRFAKSLDRGSCSTGFAAGRPIAAGSRWGCTAAILPCILPLNFSGGKKILAARLSLPCAAEGSEW